MAALIRHRACPIAIATSRRRGATTVPLQSLRQENARLRELVVQLSNLVIKTIADQK